MVRGFSLQCLPALENNDDSLKELDFSKFDGNRYHNDNSCKILARALRRNKSVTRVNLANNNVGDAGAVAMADVLKVNKYGIVALAPELLLRGVLLRFSRLVSSIDIRSIGIHRRSTPPPTHDRVWVGAFILGGWVSHNPSTPPPPRSYKRCLARGVAAPRQCGGPSACVRCASPPCTFATQPCQQAEPVRFYVIVRCPGRRA